LKINIFGECFPVPPEAYLEYVVATIDIREQGLKPLLDGKQMAIFDYRMR
ncbi:MAG: IS481 family transposase, partial [Syntrophorhabdaceae bacterium]|nr:IS481 family transposase [Syntrophorhabdaceae bacterium]MDD4197707.1 IS481 family transposase [Syntrophorhabdaceae bacterium]